MQILQVGNPVEVGLQKRSPEYLREEAKDHPYPHAATVIQLLKVLRGIQFQDWKQKYQA